MMGTVGWIFLVLSLASVTSALPPKKCFAPKVFPNTRLTKKVSPTQRFSPGARLYYRCAEGFIPSKGSLFVECVKGKWTDLSLECERISCGNAGDLPNGQFRYSGSNLGDKIEAVCNEGYALTGSRELICELGVWSGEFPTCEKKQDTCSHPAVPNSVHSAADVQAGHQVGDSLTLTCSQGFKLEGAQQITCGPGGQWKPQPPQCLPVLTEAPKPEKEATNPEKEASKPVIEAGGCGVPPPVKNADLADQFLSRTSFASGELVYYVCNIGYTRAGGSRSRRCSQGKWSSLWLKCERAQCGSAGEILNGQFTYSGVEFGDTAKAVCNTGYRLVGQATRHCMSKGWDGRVPVCEAVACEAPALVTNAELQRPLEESYNYLEVISFQCSKGNLVGKKDIWCTEDGTWSAPPPTCKEVTCLPPNIPNAYWRGPQGNTYQYRETISIVCERGYVRSGPSSLTCGSNGRWSSALPRCLYKPYRYNMRNRYSG